MATNHVHINWRATNPRTGGRPAQELAGDLLGVWRCVGIGVQPGCGFGIGALGAGALGLGLQRALLSAQEPCEGFQGPFRGLFPVLIASAEMLFKGLSRTVQGLFAYLWHWPRTVIF